MKVKNLTIKLLKRNPIWTWDNSEEYLVPFTNFDNIQDNYCLFIRANFLSNNNKKFDGYVIGFEQYYAFALLHNDREYTFNLNLGKLYSKNLKDMLSSESQAKLNFFPLQYRIIEESGKICNLESQFNAPEFN